MQFGKLFSAKPALVAAAFAAAALLAGCDEYVHITRDPDLRVAKHATWAWQPMTQRSGSRDSRPVTSRDLITRGETVTRDTSAENKVLRGKVKNAIEQSLNAKGMRFVNDPETADFLVDFILAGAAGTSPCKTFSPGGIPALVLGRFDAGEGGGGGLPAGGLRIIRFLEGPLFLTL